MTRRRRRVRASEVAPRSRAGLINLIVVLVALAVVLVFKFVVTDKTSKVVEVLTGDPDLVLPPTALERASRPDAGRGDATPAPDAGDDAARQKPIDAHDAPR